MWEELSILREVSMAADSQDTKTTTKSAQIRKMHDSGVPRAEIARSVGVRYQFVRNVIVTYETIKKQSPGKTLSTGGKGTISRSLVLPASLDTYLCQEAERTHKSVSEIASLLIADSKRRAEEDKLAQAFEQIAGQQPGALVISNVAQEAQREALKNL